MGDKEIRYDHIQLSYFADLPVRKVHLHCPICDYYFVNNSYFFKYCSHCGAKYEIVSEEY